MPAGSPLRLGKQEGDGIRMLRRQGGALEVGDARRPRKEGGRRREGVAPEGGSEAAVNAPPCFLQFS
jgi:hypothetical protein